MSQQRDGIFLIFYAIVIPWRLSLWNICLVWWAYGTVREARGKFIWLDFHRIFDLLTFEVTHIWHSMTSNEWHALYPDNWTHIKREMCKRLAEVMFLQNFDLFFTPEVTLKLWPFDLWHDLAWPQSELHT